MDLAQAKKSLDEAQSDLDAANEAFSAAVHAQQRAISKLSSAQDVFYTSVSIALERDPADKFDLENTDKVCTTSPTETCIYDTSNPEATCLFCGNFLRWEE